MKEKTVEASRMRRYTDRAAIAILLIFTASRGASGQWRASDTKNAWSGYNSEFLYTSSGYNHFSETIRGSTPSGFWQQAEEIEMAVDAYVWAETNDSGNLATYKAEVISLCNGFVLRNGTGSTWGAGDPFNDDLNWAVIAFTRAYDVTKTASFLTDAEDGFATVKGRAFTNDGGSGALCQTSPGCYEDAAVNFTYVIAGHLLSSASGNGNYNTDAQGVYTWAIADGNLYNSSTGQVYDAPGANSEYSYNYGIAIGAASESSDTPTITKVANFLMTSLGNYDGTSGGYNILPNYGQAVHDNDGGFNGITMRYIGMANVHGAISSTVLAWARTNAGQAWSIRYYPGYLMWNHWSTPTKINQAYGWDCSSALVGMLDIPPS